MGRYYFHINIFEQVCLPNHRQHLFARYRAATYFCQQTKVCKNCFSLLLPRSKRNYLSIISTPRLRLSDIPRLAGLRFSRPVAARYLWNILSEHYLVRIGRSAPEIRCRWCQRRNHPPAPQPYEEKRISPQPVRRRRKTLTALFVWCRGTACFATFFTPKKR